jgi:N-acetylglucosaminyl-diphospho-decaprenol L-rhamnosyltransferase
VTRRGVAIVIVTFRSGREIGVCLDAALATGAEVIVVDNASDDDTADQVRCRNVTLIANRDNLGFAAAVNQGIRACDAPYLLLLNPDAVIERGVDALAEACDLPGSGMACGRLVDAGGDPQSGFSIRRFPTVTALAFEALLVNRLWPRNPSNWHYRCMDFDYRTASEVEQPAGAFLMLRREVWERAGGFDERFFPLWFEDVDFCLRARRLGYHVYYVPGAVAKHTGAHSLRQIPLESRQLYWYGSFLRYASKHFPRRGRVLLCLAVITGSVIRLVTGNSNRGNRLSMAGCGRIVRLAARFLVREPELCAPDPPEQR